MKSGRVYNENTAADRLIASNQMHAFNAMSARLRQRTWRTGNRSFTDRQVGQTRHQAQGDGDQPDDVITAHAVVQKSAQPHAHERPDLVAEKHEATEH